MNRVLVQATKEWQEFRRDRLSLALAFILPLLTLLLCGYGIRLESKNIAMVVQDLDASSLSREYVQRLYATNIFVPVSWSQTSAPSDAIDQGLAKIVICIPSGFAKHILAGQTSPLQIMIDGTDITNAQIISNTIQGANAYFLKMLQPFPHHLPSIHPQLRVWFNPGRQESLFLVPGVFGVILWMYPSLLAAVAASREKEQETISRVFSSRLSAPEFLLGKALFYFAVGIALAFVVLISGSLLFGIWFAGDPSPFIIATPLYVMSSVLFGVMVGTYANSQTVAVQSCSTAGFFPCLLLSGFVYPINNMPFPLSLFSLLVPARYFIELSRDAFVRGAGWVSVWLDPLVLVLFVCTFFLVSWLKLRDMQLKD